MAEVKTNKKTGLYVGIGAAVVAVIAIVVIVLFATGVIGGKSIVGRYELTGLRQADGTDASSTLALMKAFGMTLTVDFNADKTGKMVTTSGDQKQEVEFTWDDEKITEKTSGTSNPYKVVNGKIEMTYDGDEVYVFEKK